ncbi:uroporphyrinogen decarboxylase [Laceyella putida]|uniref:Uroporphyrinogen decarboxylase n=1 Tax=Laceyella putida TaxID=110101 RepID=A0ABW2RPY5_9BACL
MNKPFNDVFLKACRKEETPYVPVWYMRQAGRYQPEYRKLRREHSFFEMSENPEICVEITRLPVEQLGVDAAILFADIMTPVKHLGIDVAIFPGIGPMITNPIRTEADIHRLGELDPVAHIPTVLEAVRILNQQLSVPLIGFAGGPFTLASYMIEGQSSKNHHKTKGLMYAHPKAWQVLMEKLADMTLTYLKAQIRAGAHAVKVFDSWVGSLSDVDFRTYVAPTMRVIFDELQKMGVPTIYFGIGAGHLLAEWNKLPVSVIGLDWRTSIRSVRAQGINKVLQGNMDPSLLLGPWELIEERAKQVLDQGMERAGYIFNLGHGIFPEVQVDVLKKLTHFVHQYTTIPEVWG